MGGCWNLSKFLKIFNNIHLSNVESKQSLNIKPFARHFCQVWTHCQGITSIHPMFLISLKSWKISFCCATTISFFSHLFYRYENVCGRLFVSVHDYGWPVRLHDTENWLGSNLCSSNIRVFVWIFLGYFRVAFTCELYSVFTHWTSI